MRGPLHPVLAASCALQSDCELHLSGSCCLCRLQVLSKLDFPCWLLEMICWLAAVYSWHELSLMLMHVCG